MFTILRFPGKLLAVLVIHFWRSGAWAVRNSVPGNGGFRENFLQRSVNSHVCIRLHLIHSAHTCMYLYVHMYYIYAYEYTYGNKYIEKIYITYILSTCM